MSFLSPAGPAPTETRIRSGRGRAGVIALLAALVLLARAATGQPPLTIAVMDPLAAPLACDCVQGFAQRDYGRLEGFLEKRIGREVRVVYAAGLAAALRDAGGPLDVVVGKASVVLADGRESGLTLRPIARLSGRDGATTLTGLFVVPAGDRARKLEDLSGYRILFGPAEEEEKHGAALAALKAAGVPTPASIETRGSCSTAACDALEATTKPGTAAVISSYALALLEGCETIDPGALRIVGRTAPVPFITVFAADSLGAATTTALCAALLEVGGQADLCTALETRRGFVAIADPMPVEDPATAEWPAWRGARRDGHAARLPEKLPAKPASLWVAPLTGSALAGIAATREHVVVADRSAADDEDVFHCFEAGIGKELWALRYPARGNLDYGNSPRATPLIRGGEVYLLGAFGDLHCVDLATGAVRWKKQVIEEFAAELPIWGMCASLLEVDGRIIVNPGGKSASLVALDAETGAIRWRTPGRPAAYASFIAGSFGGVRQIVGYDAKTLGGWEVASGKRLWTLAPPGEGDFNVPTPIDLGGRLLVATENNGTRIYAFHDGGAIIPEPVAQNDDLYPDTSTPVVTAGQVIGCSGQGELLGLNLEAGLETAWRIGDAAFEDYVSLIVSGERLLVTSARGELLLIEIEAPPRIVSRLKALDSGEDIYSHPALVGDRLYLRGSSQLICIRL